MDKKEIKYEICTFCKGNGYIKGQINTGTCIHCDGSGHKDHGPRINNQLFLNLIRYVEGYIDGEIEGWYH